MRLEKKLTTIITASIIMVPLITTAAFSIVLTCKQAKKVTALNKKIKSSIKKCEVKINQQINDNRKKSQHILSSIIPNIRKARTAKKTEQNSLKKNRDELKRKKHLSQRPVLIKRERIQKSIDSIIKKINKDKSKKISAARKEKNVNKKEKSTKQTKLRKSL